MSIVDQGPKVVINSPMSILFYLRPTDSKDDEIVLLLLKCVEHILID